MALAVKYFWSANLCPSSWNTFDSELEEGEIAFYNQEEAANNLKSSSDRGSWHNYGYCLSAAMNSFSCLLWRIGEKHAAEPDDAELVSLSKRLVENAVLKAVQQYLEETQNKTRQTDGSPVKTEEGASGSKNESDNDNSKWALCKKPGSKYPAKNNHKNMSQLPAEIC